eukprot:GHVT01094638.1.p2 GENE.GHVT01094638.1~~GHVT01094638.1.p2  ORF type:complete len:141 (+),score=20.23 GHVT01094638.1:1399-1821(+)
MWNVIAHQGSGRPTNRRGAAASKSHAHTQELKCAGAATAAARGQAIQSHPTEPNADGARTFPEIHEEKTSPPTAKQGERRTPTGQRRRTREQITKPPHTHTPMKCNQTHTLSQANSYLATDAAAANGAAPAGAPAPTVYW